VEHRPVALAMLLGLMVGAPLLAEAGPRPTTSELPLYLEVRADGVPMVLRVVEGTAGTIESTGGVKVALIPKATPDGVEIHAFDVFSTPGNSGEKAREVEIVNVAVMQTVQFAHTTLNLEVRLVRSIAPPVPPDWRLQAKSSCGNAPAVEKRSSGPSVVGVSFVYKKGPQQELLAPCSRCCVTCDGVTVCWCEVWMSCGHCCCDGPSCGACQG
jgi:hypothetical protein